MKVRNDFVTNSSSTSFIFGNKNESVDTIFSLIRIICNELVLLYNSMKKDNRIEIAYFEDEMFSDIELKNLLNKEYVNNTLFCVLGNPYIHKYFINLLYMEEETLLGLKEIIKFIRYDDYIENAEYEIIYIYDVDDMDEDYLKDCYYDFIYAYYRKLGLKDNNIEHIIDSNKSTIVYEEFIKDNLGCIYVRYEEYIFCQLFDAILNYFSNYSSNFYSYLERG